MKSTKQTFQTRKKFRLSEIIGIESYFHQEISQRKSCNKKLSKYVTVFNYIDKILVVLNATSSGGCIILSATFVGAPFGIASSSVTSTFFSNNRRNHNITMHK